MRLGSPERKITNLWLDIESYSRSTAYPTENSEELLERVVKASSNPGDIVLDCFAGSGTTGAVAHKMKRRWIMIEMGKHAHTHIIPRLEKVINGNDPAGVTELNNWKGGGGFLYCGLAPTLFEKPENTLKKASDGCF